MNECDCDECGFKFWSCQCPVQAETIEEAKKLVSQGYRQISRKYRMVARVPFGMTGRQALDQVAPGVYNSRMNEWHCADQYRRCYAKGDDVLELNYKVFREFLNECARRI